jgi:hypothetical protein
MRWVQIIKGSLYVGSRAQAQNWELLQRLAVTHIVNVSREIAEPFKGAWPVLHSARSQAVRSGAARPATARPANACPMRRCLVREANVCPPFPAPSLSLAPPPLPRAVRSLAQTRSSITSAGSRTRKRRTFWAQAPLRSNSLRTHWRATPAPVCWCTAQAASRARWPSWCTT